MSATHTVTITVGDNATGSLNGLLVDLQNAGADVSEVSVDSVQTVGIDRGDDDSGATVDETVDDDFGSVKTENNGQTVDFRFGGSYSLNAGDEVVIVFGDVDNPQSAGEYDVPVDVNPQSSGGQDTATLAVGSDAGPTETTAMETTEDAGGDGDEATTDDPDGGETTADGDTDTGTGTSSPGFGPVLALVALLASAALLARR
ncbi:MAG: PGF-CTERM sorting domain-containing protein [Halolamina sp.]